MKKMLNKKFVLGGLLCLLTAATLAACGDATATPGTIATTAADATTAAAGAATTAAAGMGAAPGTMANGSPRGQGGFNAVTGTVTSYDATSKSLTITDSKGAAQTYDATNAMISKSTAIALADLGKETLANDVVTVAGTKGSDGSYSATALVLADLSTMGNGGRGAGANMTGTPGANMTGTPGANMTGTRGANMTGTPGAGGFGGNNAGRIVVRNATVSGNTLTGTDQAGAAVTVNLTASTTITKRIPDTATDLTSGAKVSVNARPAQSGGTMAAVAITIEQ